MHRSILCAAAAMCGVLAAPAPAPALDGTAQVKEPTVDVREPGERLAIPGAAPGPDMGGGADYDGPPDWLGDGSMTPLRARDDGALGPDGLRLLVGQMVHGPDGRPLGEVVDLVSETPDGGRGHAVLSIGGFLSDSPRTVALPFDRLHLEVGRGQPRLGTGLEPAAVRDLPAADADATTATTTAGDAAAASGSPGTGSMFGSTHQDRRALWAQRIAMWNTRIESLDLDANPPVAEAWRQVRDTWETAAAADRPDAFRAYSGDLNAALNDLARAWARAAPPQQAQQQEQQQR